jgi:hypothetical protein
VKRTEVYIHEDSINEIHQTLFEKWGRKAEIRENNRG